MQSVDVVAVPGGVAEARPLIERAEQADGSSPISDQAMLAAAQGQRELLLFSRADAASAGPVAVGVVGQGELDLVVDPPARGAGIGTAALHELLASHAAAAEGVLAWAHGENPAATALLRGAGFEPVRSLFRMALDPASLPSLPADPFAVALPPGFELRTFDPAAQEDAAAWVAVNARAFASHPEQGRITLDDFALMRGEDWFDAADLFLLAAPDTSALAGFTWVKTLRAAAEEGASGAVAETELYSIGVDPEFAGHGLGRALLEVTLARMAEHRPARVTLYVDGDNERAVRMYENAGFWVDSRSTQWRGQAGARIDA